MSARSLVRWQQIKYLDAVIVYHGGQEPSVHAPHHRP